MVKCPTCNQELPPEAPKPDIIYIYYEVNTSIKEKPNSIHMFIVHQAKLNTEQKIELMEVLLSKAMPEESKRSAILELRVKNKEAFSDVINTNFWGNEFFKIDVLPPFNTHIEYKTYNKSGKKYYGIIYNLGIER